MSEFDGGEKDTQLDVVGVVDITPFQHGGAKAVKRRQSRSALFSLGMGDKVSAEGGERLAVLTWCHASQKRKSSIITVMAEQARQSAESKCPVVGAAPAPGRARRVSIGLPPEPPSNLDHDEELKIMMAQQRRPRRSVGRPRQPRPSMTLDASPPRAVGSDTDADNDEEAKAMAKAVYSTPPATLPRTAEAPLHTLGDVDMSDDNDSDAPLQRIISLDSEPESDAVQPVDEAPTNRRASNATTGTAADELSKSLVNYRQEEDGVVMVKNLATPGAKKRKPPMSKMVSAASLRQMDDYSGRGEEIRAALEQRSKTEPLMIRVMKWGLFAVVFASVILVGVMSTLMKATVDADISSSQAIRALGDRMTSQQRISYWARMMAIAANGTDTRLSFDALAAELNTDLKTFTAASNLVSKAYGPLSDAEMDNERNRRFGFQSITGNVLYTSNETLSTLTGAFVSSGEWMLNGYRMSVDFALCITVMGPLLRLRWRC